MTEYIERCFKDGVAWRVGIQSDVDWITEGTGDYPRITGAIPPLFAAYGTLVDAGTAPDQPRDPSLERRQDLAFVDVLRRHSKSMSWWIGYLDTGASDLVFPNAPRVTLYQGWRYVFVLAGPEQAATWRPAPGAVLNWKGHELPEVIFPEDRSWLVSFLWDDDWACIGGPQPLITDVLNDPVLLANARRVDLEHSATPPGDWPG